MDKWTAQNTTSLELRHVESLKPEIKVLVDIKIWYLNAFFDLTLTQFSNLVHASKAGDIKYGGSIITKYYKILNISHLCDKFVERLFEKLE